MGERRAPKARRRIADPLRDRNFRHYAGAQLLHGTGMWTHRIAELWLVYEITASALAVGLATSARAGFSIVLAPLAGTLADRVDRRMLLAATQITKALTAGVLGLIAVRAGTDLSLVLLFATILVLGVVGAIDTPLRRAFVRDVVSVDKLDAAARLHTTVMSTGRIAGGALAALLLGLGTVWACFVCNAAVSLVAAALVLRVTPTTTTVTAEERAEGGRLFAYLRRTPSVTVPLMLLCSFALFGWNLEVLIPALIDSQMTASSATFGYLVLAMSLGSLVGSVIAASRARGGMGSLVASLALTGMVIVPLAAVSDLSVGLVVFFAIGACGGGFLSLANATVQTAADPRLQGRVSAVYGVVFVGSRAVGGPILGLLVDVLGSRSALVIVGLGTVAFAAIAGLGVRRTPAESRSRNDADVG